MTKTTVKPFLKWLGGKSRLLPFLKEHIDPSLTEIVEPFVGAGAVFLGLEQFKTAYINDLNKDLISLYRYLSDKSISTEVKIEKLRTYFKPEYYSKEAYFKLRDLYNSLPCETYEDDIERACLLLYLNKHCFNGLMRYNSEGKFNTPAGVFNSSTVKPFVDKFPLENIVKAEKRLKRVIFIQSKPSNIDYLLFLRLQSNLGRITPQTLIYCDPPYYDTFTGYTGRGFTGKDHEELYAKICYLVETYGCQALISNSDTEFTRKLYTETFGRHIVSNIYNSPDIFRAIGSNERYTTQELLVKITPEDFKK